MDVLNEFTETDRQEAGFVRRVCMRIVDLAIPFAILSFIFYIKWPAFNFMLRYNFTVLVILFVFVFRFAGIILTGASVGMKVMRVELLDGYLQPLNFKSRMLAGFFILYRGADYYTLHNRFRQ
jgi:hypothetical protein